MDDQEGNESDKDWISDEALASLKMERTVNPSETETELARRIITESVPQAAMAIAHLALHSSNERTRLDAAKYVVERVLGKVGDPGSDKDGDPWDQILANVITNSSEENNAQ